MAGGARGHRAAGPVRLSPAAAGGSLRALALEPFYGGSHRAFLDGWVARSRHRWTVLGLPAVRWKWRMRGGALTFAEEVGERLAAGQRWDVVVASDMLDLAAFRSLVPVEVGGLPAVAYFHENQLTYPVRDPEERDRHFGFTNLTSALAASSVWFNSAFHRDELLAAAGELVGRLPAPRPNAAVAAIAQRSRVESPGVDDRLFTARRPELPRAGRPLRVLWAARWEFDKAPQRFFSALGRLAERGVDFRVSVLGQRFDRVPDAFGRAREALGERVDRWGWVEDRAEYRRALAEADVFVSTADHEFFGLAAVEAAAAGTRPLLPRRLAYPELFPSAEHAPFFYGGTSGGATEAEELADRLGELAVRVADEGTVWRSAPERARRAVGRFKWSERAPALDQALDILPPTPCQEP